MAVLKLRFNHRLMRYHAEVYAHANARTAKAPACNTHGPFPVPDSSLSFWRALPRRVASTLDGGTSTRVGCKNA